MASVQNISVNGERNKGEYERTPAAPIRNALRESLWSRSEDASLPVKDAAAKTPDCLKTATEEREAKIRRFREAQEAELARRRRGLEEQLLSAQKLRAQQEEERRRRLEEARTKEAERRIQVEERKRQIWEAEQERKEAILRRNLDREARIEARRNAHRNSMGTFAFGSSTPRTFDLELGQLGEGLMVAPPVRAASACSLQGLKNNEGSAEELYRQIAQRQKSSRDVLDCLYFAEDNMSRSMVSLSSSSSATFRGRRRTDLTPTPRSHTPRGGSPSHISAPRMRGTVSMTRLDQLAQPRRTFHQSPSTFQSPPPSVRRSMINLSPPISNRVSGSLAPPTVGSTQRPMGAARSMLHLNVVVTPPRLTRAARLRAQAASAWNLSSHASPSTGSGGKPVAMQGSRSPPRPPSSLSDVSAASSSAIHMRPRSAPRRPRPVSVAGIPSHSSSTSLSESSKKPIQKPSGCSQTSTKSSSRDLGVTLQGQRPSKPLPPPKPSEWKTKPRPTPPPSKDNLRLKVTRTTSGKQVEEPKLANQPVNTSTLTSPDSEAFQVSSDDSKTWSMTESRGVSISQSSIGISESSKDIQLLTESTKTGVTELKESQSNTESLGGGTTQPSVEIVQSTTKTEVTLQPTIVAQVPQQEMDKTAEDVSVTQELNTLEPEETVLDSKSSTPEQDMSKLAESLSELGVNKMVEVAPQEEETVSKPEPLPRVAKPEIKPQPDLIMQAKELPVNGSMESSQSENANRRLITSEEEARAALAEKRRLAREQAELERQRQEEEKRLEVERREREDAEQVRLLEEHRRHEEEKLARAIAEQQQREEELRIKREEESRLRAEKEEQERRAREEAERQRAELAEKLRKEEEERAERKRRVEQIMARTRGAAAAAAASTPTTNGTTTPAAAPQQNPVQQRNGSEPVSNGYSSQEDMSCTTSPEDEGVLIDLAPTPTLNVTSRHPLEDTLNSNLCSPTDNANRTTQNPPDLLL